MNDSLFTGIAENLVDGNVVAVRKNVEAAIREKIPAIDILNKGLLAGMDEVGKLFKDGEMFVPEVLVAAKAMQAGIELIKPMLLESGVETKGKILTVTVEGDLHDIGIKLVGMMLECAGFEVFNIGVDVKAEKIVEKVKEITPDILGMSAMLTTTMANMKEVIDTLKENGLLVKTKVMVGGAPLSRNYADRIGAVYSADANDAVITAKMLLNRS